MTAVTLHSDFRVQEEEICHCFHLPPFYLHEMMGLDAMILVFFFFLIFSFNLAFSLSSYTLIRRLLSPSSLSAIRRVSFTYLRLLIFLQSINIFDNLCIMLNIEEYSLII